MKKKLSPSKIKEIIEEKNLAKSDSRFAHVFKDPRYKNHQRRENKTLLDTRFQTVAKDDAFYEKTTMDRHGKNKGEFSAKEDLMKFYRLDSSDNEDSDEKSASESEESVDDSVTINKKILPSEREVHKEMLDMDKDYAREAFYSDSSDDESSSDDDEYSEESELSVVESDSNIEEEDVVETKRIAVTNANWDYIKSSDIMMLFSSFSPTSNGVCKVSIYMSEYGKRKLQEEDENGPKLFVNNEDDSPTVEYLDKLERGEVDDDGTLSDEQLRAFRKYQLRKLKYYYAIVECDSVETAMTIYKECDKTSIGTLGNSIDLRYVLDDTVFDEKPTDVCDNKPAIYEYNSFNTFDLKETKALKWDETDPKRTKVLEDVMKKAMDGENIDDDALQDYMGSGSDTDESNDEDASRLSKGKKANRLRKLLNKIDEKGDLSDDDLLCDDSDPGDVHMTETFQAKPNQLVQSESEEEQSSEEKENITETDKADLELMFMDDTNEENHLNMRDIVKESKTKRKVSRKKWEKMKMNQKAASADVQDDFKINIEDERFSMIHEGYNIDPHHPSYKRTTLMDELLKELPAKRRKYNENRKGT